MSHWLLAQQRTHCEPTALNPVGLPAPTGRTHQQRRLCAPAMPLACWPQPPPCPWLAGPDCHAPGCWPQPQIPVSSINIGPINKKDVMRANAMIERGYKKFGVILAFDVPGEYAAGDWCVAGGWACRQGCLQRAPTSNSKQPTAGALRRKQPTECPSGLLPTGPAPS